MERLICLVLGYALGIIQTGYIVGRCKGIDIRDYGSKNAGTTNVLRTLGTKYGVIVLLGDAFKCILAVLIVKLIFANSCADIICLLMLYGAAGVVLGHNFPFYMNFKGGKGIAATAGLILSYSFQIKYGWSFTLFAILIFFSIFFITHYVSLGSIAIYVSLMIGVIIVGECGLFDFPPAMNRSLLIEYYIVMLILAAMAVFRHKANIKRLIDGNERKTYLGAKPEISDNKDK